jgi:hypothetical protein
MTVAESVRTCVAALMIVDELVRRIAALRGRGKIGHPVGYPDPLGPRPSHPTAQETFCGGARNNLYDLLAPATSTSREGRTTKPLTPFRYPIGMESPISQKRA